MCWQLIHLPYCWILYLIKLKIVLYSSSVIKFPFLKAWTKAASVFVMFSWHHVLFTNTIHIYRGCLIKKFYWSNNVDASQMCKKVPMYKDVWAWPCQLCLLVMLYLHTVQIVCILLYSVNKRCNINAVFSFFTDEIVKAVVFFKRTIHDHY